MLDYDGKKRWSLEQQVAINKAKNKQNENAIEEIKHDLTSVYKIKGSRSCASLNGLTKTLSLNGNVYNVTDAGTLVNADSSIVNVNVGDNVLFIWNNGDWYWDILAGIVDLSGYLQKVTTTTSNNQVYGKDANGSQTMYNISRDSNANQIMIRDANARARVAAPAADTDCANKKYVDDGDATKIDKITGSPNVVFAYANVLGTDTYVVFSSLRGAETGVYRDGNNCFECGDLNSLSSGYTVVNKNSLNNALPSIIRG